MPSIEELVQSFNTNRKRPASDSLQKSPLAKRPVNGVNGFGKAGSSDSDSSSDSDAPAKKVVPQKTSAKPALQQKPKPADSSDSEDSSDDEPPAKKPAQSAVNNVKKPVQAQKVYTLSLVAL